MSATLCHPERSLAVSEANRQKQSKDLVFAEGISSAGSFRIAVRFLDEQGIEFFPSPSRGAAAWESPARKCRVSREKM
jgi:hypothetical protein